jgi:hypothetical protein
MSKLIDYSWKIDYNRYFIFKNLKHLVWDDPIPIKLFGSTSIYPHIFFISLFPRLCFWLLKFYISSFWCATVVLFISYFFVNWSLIFLKNYLKACESCIYKLNNLVEISRRPSKLCLHNSKWRNKNKYYNFINFNNIRFWI